MMSTYWLLFQDTHSWIVNYPFVNSVTFLKHLIFYNSVPSTNTYMWLQTIHKQLITYILLSTQKKKKKTRAQKYLT